VKNPDPSLYRFFCPAHQCWCVDSSICQKRTGLISQNEIRFRTNHFPFGTTKPLEVLPNLESCKHCEIGIELLAKKKKRRGRRRKKTSPTQGGGKS
jgi:hypothetical protein